MDRIRSGLSGKLLPWIFLAAAVISLFVLTLPFLVERIVLPPILAQTEFADHQLRVSRFGLGGCTIHIAGRPESAPLIASGNVRLHWTLPGLLRRRLDRVTCDGLLLNSGRLAEWKSSRRQSPDTFMASSGGNGLPLIVETIRIVNSFITFRGDHGMYAIPITLSAQRQEQEKTAEPDVLQYRTTLGLDGQEVRGDFIYDHRQGSLAGRLVGAADLSLLAAVFPASSSSRGQLEGQADISARYAVGTDPFSIDRIDGEVRLRDFHWRRPETGWEITAREGNGLTVAGGGARYRVSLAGFDVVGPVKAEVAAGGDVSVTGDGIGWQGDIVISPAAGQQVGPASELFIDEAEPIHLRHEGTISNGTITGRLTTGSDGNQGSGYSGRYKDGRFRAAGLEAAADFEFTAAAAEDRLTAELSLTGSGITGDLPDGGFVIPAMGIRVSAKLSTAGEADGLNVEGSLSAEGGLELLAPAVRFQGIHLNLPFSRIGQVTAGEGDFRIEDIFLRQVRLGSLGGTVVQRRQEFFLSGELRSPVLPENPIRLEARAGAPRNESPFIELSGAVEKSRLDVEHLAVFQPGLDGVSGSGTLDANGRLAVGRCGVNGGLTVSLQDGNFEIPEAQIAMYNTGFTFHLPALPRFESAPAQKLTFGTVRGKKVMMHDVSIAFQVESPESLFIEQISARWSGGRIFTNGFRLRPGRKEVEVALICDRLELAEILSQLGLAEAEGQGRMSGRIPLVYADQSISVDDGFLFTTPGEKGNLRINRSEQLTMGLPADTAQFSPLHFAGAALGNFEYNWARLNINSEEENLLLQLQIDGKPKERLPYRFDASRDFFVRLKEGESGGIDQPIKLDVNFRVPVNDLFRYHPKLIPFFLHLK